MSDRSGRRGLWLAAAAATMFALLVAGELLQEDEDLTPAAVLQELLSLALLVGATVASALLVLRMRTQEEESRLLRRDLEVVRAEGRRWREGMAVHLRELGTAIRRQFEAWGLTAAEQDIGLLLLKGLSHKEIARLRDTSEATIRQQAASLYRKAGLSGRAALSAFFLEDLLAPPPPAGRTSPDSIGSDELSTRANSP
jgi:DNA-binding CsgD family transcriptional regulator